MMQLRHQQKTTPIRPAPPAPAGLLQRKAAGGRSLGRVPSIVQEVLASPGLPLDGGLRLALEPRFGHDFSRVRVHADPKAALSARAVNALAYTAGNELVFGPGRYQPGTETGRKLIAHELAHVVQQAGGLASGGPGSLRLAPHDRHEQAAEAAAGRVASGLDAGLTGPGGLLGLQRAEEPGKDGGAQEDVCTQYENDAESFSIAAARHFLTQVDPGASQEVKSVTCEVNPNNPLRMECDVTFSDGQVIHVTWIKDLNNVEAQRPRPDGRQWCVYHYVCDTPGTVRYEKKGCSDDYKPKPARPSGPDLVGARGAGGSRPA